MWPQTICLVGEGCEGNGACVLRVCEPDLLAGHLAQLPRWNIISVTFKGSHAQKVFFCGVRQSDGNSFCWDVVSDSFNETFWNEDHILDQINKSKYVRIIIMMILILFNIILWCILTLPVALKPYFISSFLLRASFLYIYIFFNHC